MEVNVFIAFIAGIISFLSPCIFPIIPSYIGYIGAATYDDGFKRNRGAVPLILGFIAGFSIVFSIMGVAFSTLGFAFRDYAVIISRVSGSVVIILGLNTIFGFIKILDTQKKIEYKIKNRGIISSVLLGMAFGAGWSPCIGPILASILFLAGNSQTLLSGLALLLVFSAGLGLPFLLSGLFISKFKEKSKIIKNQMNKIKIFSGIFITFIGILIFLDRLSNLNAFLFRMAYNFSDWYKLNYIIFDRILGMIDLLIVLVITRFSVKKVKIGKKPYFSILLTLFFLIFSVITYFHIINYGETVLKYLTFQGL